MAEILFRDSTVIGDYKKPYIIAEINSSHNGSIETAREMIRKAKEAGCSCAKFQSWSDDTLYAASYYKNNSVVQRIVKKLSLSEDELRELALYCKEVGISFSSTPYSRKEVDALLDFGAPYIKVASMDINNYSYLRYIAETGASVVLSTGMSELNEVRKAVEILQNAGCKNLVLLHCISIYPAPVDTIHLNNILMLRKEFPECPIGFSDHTLGTEISTAAVALGSAIIEKHFTLDKTKMGMDNNMAIEPDEMTELVKNCNSVYLAMGNYKRTVSDEEYKQRKKMRRSVIVTKDLKAGKILKLGDLDVKRPGEGISASEMENLVGRTLIRDIEAESFLRLDDLV